MAVYFCPDYAETRFHYRAREDPRLDRPPDLTLGGFMTQLDRNTSIIGYPRYRLSLKHAVVVKVLTPPMPNSMAR